MDRSPLFSQKYSVSSDQMSNKENQKGFTASSYRQFLSRFT